MIPDINYQDITDQSQLSSDASRAYLPGSFMTSPDLWGGFGVVAGAGASFHTPTPMMRAAQAARAPYFIQGRAEFFPASRFSRFSWAARGNLEKAPADLENSSAWLMGRPRPAAFRNDATL